MASGGPRAKSAAAGATKGVVAVQLQFLQLPTLEHIREHMLAAVLAAMPHDPWLVVLPAWTGLLPLHLYGGSLHPSRLETSIRKYGLALAELWTHWAREMAQQFGIYLVPGSTLVPSEHERGFLHISLLVDPDGTVVGQTAQTHIPGREAAWGMMAGVDLPVWNAGGVRLGLMVGSDAWYPEVGRILALQGALLLVAPTVVPAPYSRWQQLAGPWQQVQNCQVYGIEASLAGSVAGTLYGGRAAVFAPRALTPDGSGFLARGDKVDRASLPRGVSGELNFPALLRLRRRRRAVDTGRWSVYHRHLSRLYRAQDGRDGERVPAGCVLDERFLPLAARQQ